MTPRRSPAEAVQHAVAALAEGRMVVVDDADREDEGDLLLAAGCVTDQHVAFLVRHTTGIVCVPMGAERAVALRVPQMTTENTDARGRLHGDRRPRGQGHSRVRRRPRAHRARTGRTGHAGR